MEGFERGPILLHLKASRHLIVDPLTRKTSRSDVESKAVEIARLRGALVPYLEDGSQVQTRLFNTTDFLACLDSEVEGNSPLLMRGIRSTETRFFSSP